MKKLIALFLLGIVIAASGCIGNGVGLTKEKVLTALGNIETARYDQNFSMSMYFTDPSTNRTVNMTMSGRAVGAFNKSAGIEAGNISLKMHTMGMNINVNWPYFINGTSAYFKVDGKWYNVPRNDDLYRQAKGSLNVNYIENLLRSKNVTIKKLADGYAFRVNVTFWEFINATNQTGYLNETWGSASDRINVTTNSGWVEVHLRKDGTPTFIEVYMDLTMTLGFSPGETVVAHLTIHQSTALTDVNGEVNIKSPKEIKSAGNFEDIFW
ncbi:hypothetical protein [Thermococcus sp.]|uniref:hypothetical protein n=1 Tax=Thermococcus sp. TaxID=35749 RepID=UPI0026165B10|nr:hypothetical protein [Thermococcus sp.]